MKFLRSVAVLLILVLVFSSVYSPTNVYAASYSVFILSDSTLLCENDQAPVDINNLKAFYEGDGHVVTLINAQQLASPSSFNAANCDLLVLPYGPRFPLEGIDNYKKYVREGGKTISKGFWQREADFASTPYSVENKLQGLFLSSDNIKNEIAKRDQLNTEFGKLLQYGVVNGDVDKAVDDFIAKQKAAGLDKILADLQKQVDTYLTSK